MGSERPGTLSQGPGQFRNPLRVERNHQMDRARRTRHDQAQGSSIELPSLPMAAARERESDGSKEQEEHGWDGYLLLRLPTERYALSGCPRSSQEDSGRKGGTRQMG